MGFISVDMVVEIANETVNVEVFAQGGVQPDEGVKSEYVFFSRVDVESKK